MNVINADFRGSFPNHLLCPRDTRPEYAFIGRSNVGKSSLINNLCGRKELAHTSKKPGKTQMINYYLINHQWFLVDLPGYGYAITSKKNRKAWEKMIQDYLILRPNLQCAFVLVDAMIPPQAADVEFINWLGSMNVPFVLVYTKTDRLKPDEVTHNIGLIQEELLQHWNELPQQFVTSASTGYGRDDILNFIDSVNANYEPEE